MENKYDMAIELLKLNKQNRILEFLQNSDIIDKDKVVEQVLNMDFKMLNKMFGATQVRSSNIENELQPVKAIVADKLSKQEKDMLQNKGIEIIKKNQFAVVIMAGGQGSRLGFEGPKGTFSLELNGKEKFLFEIIIDRLKDAQKEFGVEIPCFIMTSKENDKETRTFFEKHNFFGYNKEKIDFFKQGETPLLDEEGNLFIGEDCSIKFAADGNGSIFTSMKKEKVLQKMKSNNIEWVFIGSVDNILLNPVDTLLLGLAKERKTEIATRTICKNSPHEKVGVFCKKNGKVKVIEYTEIPAEMVETVNEDKEMVFGEAHIMCNLFTRKALEKSSKAELQYHVAHKRSKYLGENHEVIKPKCENSFKFEKFIFDAFELFDDITILRGNREKNFAPIKNAEGTDSPETAKKLYEEKYKENY